MKSEGVLSPPTPKSPPPANGEQPIGTIKVGDKVEAYDPQTGEASTQTVEHVWINHDTDLPDVTLRADNGAEGGRPASSDGPQGDAGLASHGLRAPPHGEARSGSTGQDTRADETVHTTANHPWLTADRGWLRADQLRVGELVVRGDGTTTAVTALHGVPGSAWMYNLAVSNVHTFAVGQGRYVVHNSSNPKCDIFERYGSEDEVKAAQKSGKLEMKKTPDGRPHRGEKWIGDPGTVKPGSLGKRANYRYKMEIEAEPGTRGWLKSQGFESKPTNEPGRYDIPWNRLDEFNDRIRSISITRLW